MEESEKLKMVYEKVAEQHRYFLSWRQYLLGSSFVVFGAIFSACFVLFEKGYDKGYDKGIEHGVVYMKLAGVLMVLNALLSVFFLRLEKTNRMLYRICQDVGGRIEQLLFSQEKMQGEEYRELLGFDLKKGMGVGLFFWLTNKSYYKKANQTHETKRPFRRVSHSVLITFIYCGTALVSLVTGLILYFCPSKFTSLL